MGIGQVGQPLNLNGSFIVLDRAAINHKPRDFYALFSGGHDSLTATAVAFKWAEKRGVKMTAAHIDTTTGIPATQEKVEAAGLRGCVWGQRPPNVHRNQLKLDVGPLCQSCELRRDS